MQAIGTLFLLSNTPCQKARRNSDEHVVSTDSLIFSVSTDENLEL